jgi:Copper type II ascorbate-dependent monooxygenase, C-terminal domain
MYRSYSKHTFPALWLLTAIFFIMIGIVVAYADDMPPSQLDSENTIILDYVPNYINNLVAHGDNTPTPEPNGTKAPTLDYVPNYYEHIQPILQASCVSCHIEGEFGHDSFEMDTRDEIIAGADDIALVVSTNYMPPWPPSELSHPFLYDRSLTNEEIAQIMAWVEAGAPIGDQNGAVEAAVDQNTPTINPDLILKVPETYTPNAEQTDDYRCFMLDPGFTEDTFITGYQIIPGSKLMAHHAILFPGTAAQRAEAESISGADGQVGWECFGGTGLSSGGPNAGMLKPLLPLIQALGGMSELQYILQEDNAVEQIDAVIDRVDSDGTLRSTINSVGGTQAIVMLIRQGLSGATSRAATGVLGSWVPGNIPAQFPDDTGLLIPAGGFIIFQMHYNTQAGVEPDQSQVVLQLSTDESIRAMQVLAINSPVEIPCPEGIDSTACQREAAIAERGNGSDLVLAVCGQTLKQYSNQNPAYALSFCDVRVTHSGWAVSIMSHMHKLGESTQTLLNPGTPDEKILIDIPAWDFDWQGDYWFAQPVWLDRGDIIRVTCIYNNSVSLSNPEPRYVVTGEGTSDEMCLNFIMVMPAEAGSPAPVIRHNQ